MRQANLSILGLYLFDNSIFDNMYLPDGVDRDVLIANICETCSDFEILYPSAPYMKQSIEQWSILRVPVWAKWQETTQYEYEPLDSVDLTRTITETEQKENEAMSQADSYVRGFNETDLQNNAKAENTGGGSESRTYTRTETEKGDNSARPVMDLIKMQREVVNFDIYTAITNDFKNRYCIPVY